MPSNPSSKEFGKPTEKLNEMNIFSVLAKCQWQIYAVLQVIVPLKVQYEIIYKKKNMPLICDLDINIRTVYWLYEKRSNRTSNKKGYS